MTIGIEKKDYTSVFFHEDHKLAISCGQKNLAAEVQI